MDDSSINELANATIKERTETAKLLASKFPELIGLSYEDFLMNCPIELDFITSCEMYKALNKLSG